MPPLITKKPMPLHKMNDRAKRNDNYRYQIIPLDQRVAKETIELDGVAMPYGRSGAFMTDDEGVANAIKDKYGERSIDVWDVKSHWHPSDKGHRYTFQGIAMPWHKYDEFGRLIKNKDENVIIENNENEESDKKNG